MREVYKLVEKNIAADFLVYRLDEYNAGLKLGDPFLKTISKRGKTLYDIDR